MIIFSTAVSTRSVTLYVPLPSCCRTSRTFSTRIPASGSRREALSCVLCFLLCRFFIQHVRLIVYSHPNSILQQELRARPLPGGASLLWDPRRDEARLGRVRSASNRVAGPEPHPRVGKAHDTHLRELCRGEAFRQGPSQSIACVLARCRCAPCHIAWRITHRAKWPRKITSSCAYATPSLTSTARCSLPGRTHTA